MSAPAAVASALAALFEERRADGTPRWSPEDIAAARAVLLLDLARRGEAPHLAAPILAELGELLERIGIDATTLPARVEAKVDAFFASMVFDRAILAALDGALRRSTAPDGVEAAPGGHDAYRRLTDQAPATAPRVGESPREGTQVQSLAQRLGVKVRI
jgi:hypothetical protein